MKIKKIIDLIKKSGNLCIYEGKDGQWLSDGYGVYPIYDMPEICAATLCAMYDITQKQADKMRIVDCLTLPSTYSFESAIENEQILAQCPIEIIVGDKRLVSYATSQGIAFVDKRYFAPFSDMDESMLRVYERYTSDGNLYFAVKNGMATACTIALQNVKDE